MDNQNKPLIKKGITMDRETAEKLLNEAGGSNISSEFREKAIQVIMTGRKVPEVVAHSLIFWKDVLPTVSPYAPHTINYAIRFTWKDLLNFNHPLWGRRRGVENCRIDALPENFLTAASGPELDRKAGKIVCKLYAHGMTEEELRQMVRWLYEACTPRQVKQIRALFRRINNENQSNRTRKRDRKIWIHDIIFCKWHRDDSWAQIMRAICETFGIPLPPEFEKEWHARSWKEILEASKIQVL